MNNNGVSWIGWIQESLPIKNDERHNYFISEKSHEIIIFGTLT
jgi:hypothetical protein